MYLRTTTVEDMLALPAQLEDLHTLLPSTPLLDIKRTEICAHVHWESYTRMFTDILILTQNGKKMNVIGEKMDK